MKIYQKTGKSDIKDKETSVNILNTATTFWGSQRKEIITWWTTLIMNKICQVVDQAHFNDLIQEILVKLWYSCTAIREK